MSAGLYMTQADIASQYKDLRCFINNDPVSLVTYGTQELSANQAQVGRLCDRPTHTM